MSLIICGSDMMRVTRRECSLLLCSAGSPQTGGSAHIATGAVRQELFPFVCGGPPPELGVRLFEKSLSCMKHKLCSMESS